MVVVLVVSAGSVVLMTGATALVRLHVGSSLVGSGGMVGGAGCAGFACLRGGWPLGALTLGGAGAGIDAVSHLDQPSMKPSATTWSTVTGFGTTPSGSVRMKSIDACQAPLSILPRPLA